MSDEIPSPRDPMDENITDAEVEEREGVEAEEVDNLGDADVLEEIDEEVTATDVDDAEIADSEA